MTAILNGITTYVHIKKINCWHLKKIRVPKNKFREGEVDAWERGKVKGWFHGPMEIYKINRRCIQISPKVLQTSRHR